MAPKRMTQITCGAMGEVRFSPSRGKNTSLGIFSRIFFLMSVYVFLRQRLRVSGICDVTHDEGLKISFIGIPYFRLVNYYNLPRLMRFAMPQITNGWQPPKLGGLPMVLHSESLANPLLRTSKLSSTRLAMVSTDVSTEPRKPGSPTPGEAKRGPSNVPLQGFSFGPLSK